MVLNMFPFQTLLFFTNGETVKDDLKRPENIAKWWNRNLGAKVIVVGIGNDISQKVKKGPRASNGQQYPLPC